MKTSNLQQDLFDSGLIEDGSAQELQAFKKKYRATYVKQYNQQYHEKKKRKTLIFSIEEFAYLEHQAQKHQQKLSPFLKAVIFGYLDLCFVSLQPDTISHIEAQLRQINQRIAESVQYIHLSQHISVQDIEALKRAVYQLEVSVAEALNQPPRLEQWLKQQVQQDPFFISKLLVQIARMLES